MEFHERLAELRNKRGFTQAQMAEKLNVKRARYNAWEQAISQPNVSMLNEIAKYHNVSTDYLMGNTEMPNAEFDRKRSMDPDIRVIQRAANEMTPEQRKQALDMWNVLFKDVMNDAKKHEGVDDGDEEG